jgi:uracil-DNA glycosylase family 4
MKQPLVSYGTPLPYINFNKHCKLCNLGSDNAICGSMNYIDLDYSMTENISYLSNLKLIVLSDYPGYYEDKKGYCMYDNEVDRIKKKSLERGWPNAGNYIRRILESWGLDTDKEVYFSNIVKCKPKLDKPKETTNIQPCVETWLLPELSVIENEHSTVPILILGRVAFIGFKKYVPNSPFGSSLSLSQARRNVYFYKNHPVVVSVNPAAVCGGRLKLEFTPVEYASDLKAVRELSVLKGSPEWHYYKDISLIRNYL